MNAERFIDTNILLYGYDLDAGNKRAVASSLIEEGWKSPGKTAISVQVLQEFQVNFTRKGFPYSEVNLIIEDLCRWPVINNTLPIFRHGLSLQQRWQLSLWDSMILAAAHASGAHQLITEDLQHGQNFDGIQTINPFI